jgi:hypothetical protein
MCNLQANDFVSGTLSAISVLVSLLTFALSYRYTRRTAVLARNRYSSLNLMESAAGFCATSCGTCAQCDRGVKESRRQGHWGMV